MVSRYCPPDFAPGALDQTKLVLQRKHFYALVCPRCRGRLGIASYQIDKLDAGLDADVLPLDHAHHANGTVLFAGRCLHTKQIEQRVFLAKRV